MNNNSQLPIIYLENTRAAESNPFSHDCISINYIVYEKNDDGLLLDCQIEKEDKSYHTTICIDFCELNRLIGVIYAQHDIDIYSLISEHIVSNNNSICEVNLIKELGHPITINNYSFNQTLQLRRA